MKIFEKSVLLIFKPKTFPNKKKKYKMTACIKYLKNFIYKFIISISSSFLSITNSTFKKFKLGNLKSFILL